ncbi:NADPH:quinone reductase [Streptomyces cadmiisoli]|uniref:NADPH:quinone reductase n=1 Tax=Streptomyces cadmiisoli TaxID=2184053 RepID=A0A2Z4JCW5_9ACTN|nr:NADPH:quinone reductase [Streptomyces cadmiisoli]AWW42896.1 NADPH:quinone reductase [Streptomyces cadmiisoli]
MRAAYITEHGTPDVIRYADLPVPTPGPTDVLVKVDMVSVNHVDTFVRSGAYATSTPFPFVIGRDLVGTVAGSSVARFAPGDRVWSNSLGHAGRQGSFAEYAAVPHDRLYHLPDGVDAELAAPLLHTAATAHLALFRTGSLAPGETVLIAGAGGGVGSALVQLAAAAGARVVATCSPTDFEWCETCGAEQVFDYADPELNTRLREAAGDGYDLWIDNSGRHDLQTAVAALAHGGRIIALAGMTARPELPIGALYTKDASIRGFAISNASTADLADAARLVNHLLSTKRLVSRARSPIPLSQAAEAHRQMEAGARDRILLTV